MGAGGELDGAYDMLPEVPAPADGSPWVAPTDVERRLYDLARAGNAEGYRRVLAAEGVFHFMRPADTHANPRRRRRIMVPRHDGRRVFPVYTQGMLPPPEPGSVMEFLPLHHLSLVLPSFGTRRPDAVVVNPKTPCELVLPVTAAERGTWKRLHGELYDGARLGNRIVTLRDGSPGTPGPGALLHGMACGAHLCYVNGDTWNTVDFHGGGYSPGRRSLRNWWGVAGRADWLRVQRSLLDAETSPWYWDLVLSARSALERRHGAPVDPVAWRDRVATTVRARSAGVAAGDPRLERGIATVTGLVGKVLRYEARFRADGLLPPDGVVRTIAAWDLGRASAMARWARGARYAHELEMISALEAASAAARARYRTWSAFSAAYVLGRCLHFDEERFGTWYTEMLSAHRALTTAADSPWRLVPFAG